MLLCSHDRKITSQVQPVKDLISNLDDLHPEILVEHEIEPRDYKKGLVFRSAIESIRGTFISSSTTARERFVEDILISLLKNGKISAYEHSGPRERFDFIITVEKTPKYIAALEVKGGEGNSINISERPNWADEFGVWCHLDGAIVNDPSKGAQSILNRVTNEMVRRNKQVDFLIFKDVLCGSRIRPCPKYPGNETTIGLNAAPDIFLMPQRIPTVQDPNPGVHTIDMLKVPKLILNEYGITDEEFAPHLWEVHVRVVRLSADKYRRVVEVRHQNRVVSTSPSRSWITRGEE